MLNKHIRATVTNIFLNNPEMSVQEFKEKYIKDPIMEYVQPFEFYINGLDEKWTIDQINKNLMPSGRMMVTLEMITSTSSNKDYLFTVYEQGKNPLLYTRKYGEKISYATMIKWHSDTRLLHDCQNNILLEAEKEKNAKKAERLKLLNKAKQVVGGVDVMELLLEPTNDAELDAQIQEVHDTVYFIAATLKKNKVSRNTRVKLANLEELKKHLSM